MAAVVIALVAAISPRAVHAEYFIPTSLGGSLGYAYGYSRVALSESEQSSVILNINGGGYFWQPWFLTMGAGVGLGLSGSDSSASAGNTAKTVSGGMDFTLFPDSRFPTSFGFGVSDSRQEVKDDLLLRGQDSQTRRFYIRQTYDSLGGMNVNAWFNQNAGSTSGQVGESIDRSIGFQIRKRFPYNDFQFGGGMFENDPATSDITSVNSNLLLSHNYFPSAEVGVNSSASYSNAKTTGGSASEFSSTYEQLSSSFYWRPEHRPYFVSGGVLVYTVLSGPASKGVATNANASYQFARNLSVNAGLSVSVSDADGNQAVSSTQSLTTSIPSDQYTIFGFDYGWNVGLGLSNSVHRTDNITNTATGESGQEKDNQQSVNVSASHHLGRSWNLGRYTTTNFSFGQSASASKSSNVDSVSLSLAHSVSTGWNNFAFGGSTSANASASYSQTFGQDDAAFVVVTGQLARNQEISRLSSLSGSINFQASQARVSSSTTSNDATTQDDNRVVKSASAVFSYAHSRFLGVHGLIYNSTLSVPALLKEDSTQSTSAKDWDNTFSYRIGLLALNLTARASESGPGQRAYSMTFSAVRSF